MNRFNEIIYTLGLNILFPRFCLFVLIPCGLLLAIPSPHEFLLPIAVLHTTYGKIVLTGSLLLFGLNVAANLGISRYLRLHQTQDSPYVYKAIWDWGNYSSYFRIQIRDKAAFRKLLNEVSQEHPKEAIRYWLLMDNVLVLSAGIVISIVAMVFTLLPGLAIYLWDLLKKRSPPPAAQE